VYNKNVQDIRLAGLIKWRAATMGKEKPSQAFSKLIRNSIFYILAAFTLLSAFGFLLIPTITTQAAPALTITPITWDVVGLDEQDINQGPNQYPIGVRVCNTGDTQASNLSINFSWDSTNPYINLISNSSIDASVLAAQNCKDFYFNIVINRTEGAKNTYRQYHITASSPDAGSVSTPIPREIYVVALNQETNNNLSPISGPTVVNVGEIVEYSIQQSTIPDYQQLMSFINFPTDIFQILSVSITYGTPTNLTRNQVYADACGWDSNPGSATFLQCIGPPPTEFPNGIVGSSIAIHYMVQVIAPGTANLSTTIYGYNNGNYNYQYNPNISLLTVTAIEQATATGTATQTPTATFTSTQTATITGTPPTATLTQTPTVTGTPPTSTPTFTGTPPTPTATGTIFPGMNISKSVSASSAKPGQSLIFTIKVSNTGLAPAIDVKVTDTFQYVVNIISVATTKGTYTVNTSSRQVTYNIGTMAPNEAVTLTVTTKVNSAVTSTSTFSNFARLFYKIGETTLTKNSNTVSYQIVIGGSLPPTGFLPVTPDTPKQSLLHTISISIAIILGFTGIILIIWGISKQGNKNSLTGWFISMGSILLITAILFGLLSISLNKKAKLSSSTNLKDEITNEPTWFPTEEGPWILLPTSTELAILPDYPVPTPEPGALQNNDELDPDISSIDWITIPAIEVDTVVKYVPYNGLTWMISGLKQEIAWMGETSWPGLGGNTALAGHITLRDGSDGPFRYLSDLSEGDVINIFTEEKIYTYAVREQTVVEGDDLSILEDTETPQLTLITCTGWDPDVHMYLKRLIVYSDLIEVKPLVNSTHSD